MHEPIRKQVPKDLCSKYSGAQLSYVFMFSDLGGGGVLYMLSFPSLPLPKSLGFSLGPRVSEFFQAPKLLDGFSPILRTSVSDPPSHLDSPGHILLWLHNSKSLRMHRFSHSIFSRFLCLQIPAGPQVSGFFPRKTQCLNLLESRYPEQPCSKYLGQIHP